MLYLGQTHTVDVLLTTDEVSDLSQDLLRAAFEKHYLQSYGRLLDDVEIGIINLRTAVIGKRPKFDLSTLAPTDSYTIEHAKTDVRQVYFNGENCEATIYDRLVLPIGAKVTGPCVLEQPDTTIWIEPGFCAEVDVLGNLIVTESVN